MQKTTNYKLPKWEKADRILMDDFNGLTGTLDTALHGVAVSAEAAQAAADSEAADRQAAVAAEATARESADTALGTRITNEATARANAVTAEATARENADAALRTAVDGKQAKLTGAATSIAANNLTASRALVSDANGKVAVSAVTAAELGYLDGVTSAVQTQLNGKAASSHTHAQSAITGLTAALAAKGNCRIVTGTYVGNGKYGSGNVLSLSFTGSPIALIVTGGHTFFCPRCMTTATSFSTGGNNYYSFPVTWTANSVSWYYSNPTAAPGCNESGVTYHYYFVYLTE